MVLDLIKPRDFRLRRKKHYSNVNCQKNKANANGGAGGGKTETIKMR